jgi:hypothetical protein
MCKIEDRLFTEFRLRVYGSLVLSAIVLSMCILAHRWPLLANGNPNCIDFGWMWLSGKFAIAGDAARIFDYPAWSEAQAAFYGPAGGKNAILSQCTYFNRFYYPPTYLFFTYSLGFLSYVGAIITWVITSFSLYQVAVYAIVPRVTSLILATTPVFVVLSNVYTGHNGFFSAAFFGLSLVFMERRPWVAGIFLGLLTYKPHLGLLFPVALLASRNWRAIGSATLTAAVLVIGAAVAFGYEGWTSFFAALTDRTPSLAAASGFELEVQSIFGFAHWLGASTWTSWSAQVSVSLTVIIGIWTLWAAPISYNLKAAALSAGSLLVSPYTLPYDLIVLSIAVAFFIKEGLARGFLPGERTAILICWLLVFFIMADIGAMASALLLFLITRRIAVSRAITNNTNATVASLAL